MAYVEERTKEETWITVKTYNYYIRNPAICLFVGLVCGWISFAIGAYTDWYSLAAQRLWVFFFIENLWLGLLTIGLSSATLFAIYRLEIKPKKRKLVKLMKATNDE